MLFLDESGTKHSWCAALAPSAHTTPPASSPSNCLRLLRMSELGQVRPGGLDHVLHVLTLSITPGGTGGYKLGSNYAAGVVPQMKAAALGYQQILWLYGEEHRLTEVGTMNLFVALEHEDGSKHRDSYGSAIR